VGYFSQRRSGIGFEFVQEDGDGQIDSRCNGSLLLISRQMELMTRQARIIFENNHSVRFFDPQGQELPDDAAAISAAKQLAKHISQHPINEGLSQIRVTDSSGRVVATVPIP
jgi:hypothetical protein